MQWLAPETAFSEEVTNGQESNDPLLALFGFHGELDPTALHIEDCIGRITLLKDDLLPLTSLGELSGFNR